jgi:DNA-binding NtrC family response regulator
MMMVGIDTRVVVLDLEMPGWDGFRCLEYLRDRHPAVSAIVLTASDQAASAVKALKLGALDYVTKPFDPEDLFRALRTAFEMSRVREENRELRDSIGDSSVRPGVVADSKKMRVILERVRKVARLESSVLLTGESGVGKGLVARLLHSMSPRASGPFITVSCPALPRELLESELFGHERGAFTGAHRTKRGYVEEADGGTIFLDEIGDMSRSLQAKLLRFLEDGSFTRVGGTQELRVQVRLIAATNRNIVEAIKKGEFREDLFHRLNVMQFRPPPLRERGSDIPLLARNFLKGFAAKLGRSVKDISPLAMQALQAHSWPGNVRELRNVIERAVILEPTEWIQPASLPDFEVESRLRDGPVERSGAARGGSLPEALLRFEREMILDALESCGGSLSKAASALDLSRHSLRYRMGRLGLGVDGGVDEDMDTGTGSPVR